MRYLVPMFVLHLKGSSDDTSFKQVWLFLERNATHFLEIPAGAGGADYALEFARENELRLAGEPVVDGPFVFLPVDPADPGLVNFYMWCEVSLGSGAEGNTPKEAWRPFLWSTTDTGVNRFLDEIILGNDLKETAYAVLSRAVVTLP
jgi:hypothetical protein